MRKSTLRLSYSLDALRGLKTLVPEGNLVGIEQVLAPLDFTEPSFPMAYISEVLFAAIEHDQFEIAQFLVSKGLKWDNMTHIDPQGVQTPYYALIDFKRSKAWFELFYQGGHQTQPHHLFDKKVLLEYAMDKEHEVAVDFLLIHQIHRTRKEVVFGQGMLREKSFYSPTWIQCFRRLLQDETLAQQFSDEPSFHIWRKLIFVSKENQDPKRYPELFNLFELTKRYHSLNATGDSGCTPLMFCGAREAKEVFQWMIHEGASISTPDFEGDTCLHWLSYGILNQMQDRVDMLNLLADQGMDLGLQNNQAQTLGDLLQSMRAHEDKCKELIETYESRRLQKTLQTTLPESVDGTRKSSARL